MQGKWYCITVHWVFTLCLRCANLPFLNTYSHCWSVALIMIIIKCHRNEKECSVLWFLWTKLKTAIFSVCKFHCFCVILLQKCFEFKAWLFYKYTWKVLKTILVCGFYLSNNVKPESLIINYCQHILCIFLCSLFHLV